MASIWDWWSNLETVNQCFYGAAVFFSVFFLWQLISAIVGLGDHGMDHDIDTSVDTMADHGVGDATAAHDAAATVDVFRLLSLRSVLAFFTLFTWAGALYQTNGVSVPWSLLWAFLWGLAGFIAIGLLMSLLWKMAETGNIRLASAVGQSGTVYLNIAAGGEGEIRVAVSGVVRTVRARVSGGRELKAGSPVKVSRVLGPNLVEVEPA